MNTTAGATSPQDRPDFNHDVDAPGANDNGSGTALTIELARVFAESGIDFDATLVFALWAGEEQGLLGSARMRSACNRRMSPSMLASTTTSSAGPTAVMAASMRKQSGSMPRAPRIRCRGRWRDSSRRRRPSTFRRTGSD